MSEIVIDLCGCCEKILKEKNGLSVKIRYSMGGWGSSKVLFETDHANSEICLECYEVLQEHLNDFTNAWENRRKTNRPKEIKL